MTERGGSGVARDSKVNATSRRCGHEDGVGADMAHPKFPLDLSVNLCDQIVQLLELMERAGVAPQQAQVTLFSDTQERHGLPTLTWRWEWPRAPLRKQQAHKGTV